jgi:signal transduction histidine kinase
MPASGGARRVIRRSIFAKLLVTMLAQALVILLAVGLFFSFVLGPSLGASVDKVTEESATLLASMAPDFKTARRLAAHLEVEIGYEGPDGSWATADGLPAIAEVLQAEAERGWSHQSLWRKYHVARNPDGGRYLFVWEFRAQALALHNRLLLLLLVVLVGVVLTAHAFIRRTLKPLRALREGVSRLSEGNLEVTVPSDASDELGALGDAFNDMVQRVRGMVAARDQLLVDVSHELRSPITRMKVALELLPDSEKRQTLESDVAEMEAMITEILEIERLKDGRGGLRPQPRDVTLLVREVVDAFRERGPGVRVAGRPEEVVLEVDAGRVKTVLKNLLENAVKLSLPDSQPVEVSVTESEGKIVVGIQDDGPGIPPVDLPNLFEPFFRVDRSRSKRTGGYGLGLSMCKRIMEAHGGSIAAENNPDRGARFVLTFRK